MERDRVRKDLRDSLGVITGRTQLLQRQVLRANGLLALERDQLLGGLAGVLEEVRRVGDRVEDLIAGDERPVDSPPELVVTRFKPPA